MNPVINWRVERPEQAEQIAVGDRVLSYDFEHRDDCYVEGTVEVIEELWGCQRYGIRCTYSVHSGDRQVVDPEQSVIHPPVNGTQMSTGGFANFVRKLAI